MQRTHCHGAQGDFACPVRRVACDNLGGNGAAQSGVLGSSHWTSVDLNVRVADRCRRGDCVQLRETEARAPARVCIVVFCADVVRRSVTSRRVDKMLQVRGDKHDGRDAEDSERAADDGRKDRH